MHSKKNNVIISGLDLQARSYARATSGNDSAEANGTSSQSGGEFAGLRKKVPVFVNETMGVQLLTSDIIACRELPGKRRHDGEKELEGHTYIRERTTYAKNAALFKKARDLRKHGNIDSTWTYNGKVFLKKSQSTSPKEIKLEEDLRPFLS